MKLTALIKKEFHRFFHDPRLIAAILLPNETAALTERTVGGANELKGDVQ